MAGFEEWKSLSGVSARVSVASDNAQRIEQCMLGWEAYLGKTPDALKPDPKTGVNHNVKVNYARLIVDVNVTHLFGQEPIWESDGKSGDSSEATKHLDRVWAANKKMLLLQKMAQNGSICGHVFVRILKPKPGEKEPRLINLSPEYVRVVVDPEDIDSVQAYIIEYDAVDTDGQNISVRTEISRSGAVWQILENVWRGKSGGVPETTPAKAEQRREVWPYSWAPIVDCQNLPLANTYYGMADIEEDTRALGKAINFIASNIRRILYFHGHPKTWGSGFNADELPSDPQATIAFKSPTATLQNLEMTSDLSASMAYYDKVQAALFDTSRLPAVATGHLEEAGDLSGTAMQIAYRPLTSVIAQKRLTYGEMLTTLNKHLLEMGGHGADKEVTIQWPEILPVNNLEERQVALIDKQLGASSDTLLWKMGYDAETEMKKKAEEDTEALERQALKFDQGVGESAGAYGDDNGGDDERRFGLATGTTPARGNRGSR